jgi:hypothetical protein
MKHRTITIAVAVLLVGFVQRPALLYSQSTDDHMPRRIQRALTADQEFVMAFTAARALRYVASARGYIVQNTIPAAEREIGTARMLVDDMNSRFPAARADELISAARSHLTYEAPKQVIADLDSITSALAGMNPDTQKEVRQHLDRARHLMEKGDRKADQELAAAAEALIYTRSERPLRRVEKQLMAAEKELHNRRSDDADHSLQAAESGLKIIAVQVDTPMFQTKINLWRATINYAAGHWAEAKADLKRAAALSEQAVKSATTETRAEIQDLYGDIGALLNKFNVNERRLGNSIRGVWERSDSLVERTLNYNTAAWDKFQSTSPASPDLIQAKLHVEYADSYEFTNADKQQAGMELAKAESYLKKAQAQMSDPAKPKLEAIDQELSVAKAEVGNNDTEQRARYETIRDDLARLIH